MKRTLALAVLAITCVARPSAAQGERGWVDISFGAAKPAEGDRTSVANIPRDQEIATFAATYHLDSGAYFEVGGGYMISPVFGLGINLSGAAQRGTPDLRIRIPHPNFFNAFATDARPGNRALDRAEGAFSIQAMVNLTPTSPHLRVRVFGGPSHFGVTQDSIDDIRYEQHYGILTTLNEVTITDYTFSEREGSGWGFHGGVDVAYFFGDVVGVGGLLRFSRGTVELSDFSGSQDVKVGGVQFGGGLRLKFGG